MLHQSISVVVVDDHILIAKAISSIINCFSNFHVLYEAENGLGVIDQFKSPKNIPDIVLLDVSMPLMDGYETVTWLTQNHPSVKVIALSMADDDSTLIKMIKNGAKGYLLKNVHPKELEKALISVMERGFYYPDWATNILLDTVRSPETITNPVHINDREKEFLKYAVTDLTYKEIGDKMYCSPRTVEGYRDALFEKLNTKSRVGLVVYAIKMGLVKV